MPRSNGSDVQENCLTCQWRQARWFCGLPGAELRRLQRIALRKAYDAGSILYREGQAPEGLFILCGGRVKVSVTSKRGSVVIVKVAEPGEALGLEALLANHPHEETAELLDSCQVKFLPKDRALPFLNAHSAAALKAASQLNANCRTAREQIRHIGLSVSGRERLTRLLITWANAGKSAQPLEKIVKAPFTHLEIAQMVGSTRETVTRALNNLKRTGVLEVRGKTFIVKDVEELQRLINE